MCENHRHNKYNIKFPKKSVLWKKKMTKKQEKKSAETYYNRGLAHSKKGELELAIAAYTKAIELKSDYADAYYCRSKVWLRLGEEEKAKSDMKIASNIGINIKTTINETLKNYDRAWKILGNISDI